MNYSSYYRLCCFSLTFLLFPLAHSQSSMDALMLRFPDVSDSDIVFVYAEDIWIVSKQGGIARRLSSAKGMETFPKFSPDGQQIAFSGNYDGNTDVYVMSAKGGSAKRLTHHPGDERMIDWYPDGQHILFASGMESYSNRFNQFYKQSIVGGMPQKLPLAYAEFGSFNPAGNKLAYQYLNNEFRTWKRYQGGTASQIWIHDFSEGISKKITDYMGDDALPMWLGDNVYFISTRGDDHRMNIWAYNTKNENFTQLTHFKEYDVKFPSIGLNEIVFENGGKLFLLSLADGRLNEVKIDVPSEQLQVRPGFKKVHKSINNFGISPTGQRAFFEARGDIFTVPKEHGSIRNITQTSGVAERYPSWSPDGKYIAYFADIDGEYALYLRPSDGKGTARKITKSEPGFRYYPKWSPDNLNIAYSDKTGSIFIVDVVTASIQKVDRNIYMQQSDYSWSPDSRWLVYSKNKSFSNRSIHVYNLEQKKASQLTSGFYDDRNPVFSQDGKYLFYHTNRHFSPVYGDFDATWIYPNATNIAVANVSASDAYLFASKSDEENIAPEITRDSLERLKQSDKKGKLAKENTDKDKEAIKVNLDLDGFELRARLMPLKNGNYGALSTVEDKLIYLKFPDAGSPSGQREGKLGYYDLKKQEEKEIISGVNAYQVSADGKKLIYKSGDHYAIIDVDKDKKKDEGKLDMSDMTVKVDIRKEWNQIFMDAWRLQRDFFYDPEMHKVNWEQQRDRYQKMIQHAVSRQDLNYIIGEMVAELNVGHAYIRGGDLESPEKIGVGLLGADFELDEKSGFFKIAKIYRGAVWDLQNRSPLAEPGLNIKEGDFLLRVNNVEIDKDKDIWASFQGLDNKVVILTINSKPTLSGSREVLVKTIDNEARARNLEWIENNRKKVFEATDGRIGYIYVPNTGIEGQNELVRMFQGQHHMEGLIIDERFNSGGQIPDRFVEMLNRPLRNYWGRRDHEDWQTPFIANDGPKVMLANEWAGSGGDAFPYYFKQSAVGPVVGKRTWGGLVGISGIPALIDGGYYSAPNFGFYNLEGEWDVEGYGVDPDFEIENPADVVFEGKDPQLEKAIALILEALNKKEQRKTKPGYPDKRGLGN